LGETASRYHGRQVLAFTLTSTRRNDDDVERRAGLNA